MGLIGPIEAYPTTDSQPRAHRILRLLDLLDLLHLLAPSAPSPSSLQPPYSTTPTLLH